LTFFRRSANPIDLIAGEPRVDFIITFCNVDEFFFDESTDGDENVVGFTNLTDDDPLELASSSSSLLAAAAWTVFGVKVVRLLLKVLIVPPLPALREKRLPTEVKVALIELRIALLPSRAVGDERASSCSIVKMTKQKVGRMKIMLVKMNDDVRSRIDVEMNTREKRRRWWCGFSPPEKGTLPDISATSRAIIQRPASLINVFPSRHKWQRDS
jgi:hypothetical protein